MAFQRSHLARTFARTTVFAVAAAALALAGCSSMHLPGLGGATKTAAAQGGSETAIGVNAYLWRASLSTLAFMPLASADPYGGIINTDWYADPSTPNERFKVTVYILDTRLRADGINVAITKQVKTPTGDWQNAASSPNTAESIENAILVRARQMRINGR